MRFDERNALNTNFLKAIFSVTGRVSANAFSFLLNVCVIKDYYIHDVNFEMSGFISLDDSESFDAYQFIVEFEKVGVQQKFHKICNKFLNIIKVLRLPEHLLQLLFELS